MLNNTMDIVILTSGPATRAGTAFHRNPSDHPNVYRTIGAYKIANVCRKEGLSTKVIDHIVHFSTEELIEALRIYIDDKTSILAISTTFVVSYGDMPENVIDAVSVISKEFPNLKIIMGGYYTYASRKISGFDTYAVITEYGEDIFRDVVNFICKNQPEPSFTIDFITKTNKLIKVYSTPLTHSHNIETDNFRFHPDDSIVKGEALPLEVSRGCIFKCKFCNHLLLGRGKLDYLRNFELIREELIYNYENWGTKAYYIICDTFNDTEYKMIEWHKMISTLPFKIKYTAYLRADLLDKFKDVPYLLKESGLISAFHGIESLNRPSALAVGKGWSGTRAREYIPELYHNIWKKEVFQSLSFIVGLPGETKESVRSTVDWFNENDLKHIIFQPLYLTNVKGVKNLSEFERDAEKYGYSFENKILSRAKLPNWKNDYWSLEEVVEFINTDIVPHLGKNHYLSSWLVVHYLGLGIPPAVTFDRKNYLRNDIVFNYLKEYKKLILKK
jgi:Radical SAM superfamily